jgi:hypothetical protein
MHSYTVEVRIWSDKDDFNISAISEDLGITPTNTRRKGEPKSSTNVFAEAMWGYEVYSGEWESLEEALDATLKIFMPLKDKLTKYETKYDVILWCGHFTSSFDGGPTFSPELLKKLGEFGVELFLDTYCSRDEGQFKEKSLERGQAKVMKKKN